MKKFLSLLLSFSFLAVLCCSCADSGIVPEVTDAPGTSLPETSAVVVTEEVTTRDTLPEKLDFGGRTFTLYCDKDLPVQDFHAAEVSGDIINDALFKRQQDVSERLHAELVFKDVPGSSSNKASFMAGVENETRANNHSYDLVGGYSLALAGLAVNGVLVNLPKTEYLDFSRPWWPASLIECATVRDKLFFASGDISTSMLAATFSVFMNLDLMREYNMENVYELVDSGKWTLDKMLELTSDIYMDLNGNGTKDNNDRFALLALFTSFDNLYFSSGLHITEKTADGEIVVSPDWTGEKAVTLVEKVCDAMHNRTSTLMITNENDAKALYAAGNSVFGLFAMNVAYSHLRGVSFSYGLVPTPKWDENQESYRAVSGYTGALFGIPTDAQDINESSALMEAYAAEGYYTVSPAFFELSMKTKYSSSSDCSRMFDIIRASQVYDLGRIFSTAGLNSIPQQFRNALQNNTPQWASLTKATAGTLEKLLAGIVEKLGSYE